MIRSELDLDTNFRLDNYEQELDDFRYQIKTLSDDLNWLKQEVVPSVKSLTEEVLILRYKEQQPRVLQSNEKLQIVERFTEIVEQACKTNSERLLLEIKVILYDLRDELLYLHSLGVKQSQVQQNDTLPYSTSKESEKPEEPLEKPKLKAKEPERDLFDRVWDSLPSDDLFLRLTLKQKEVLKLVVSNLDEDMTSLGGQIGKSRGYIRHHMACIAKNVRRFERAEVLAEWQLRVDNYLKEIGNELV